jgi:hypothetical protein
LSSRFSVAGCPAPEGIWLSGERVITRVDSFHSTSSFSPHGRTSRALLAIFTTEVVTNEFTHNCTRDAELHSRSMSTKAACTIDGRVISDMTNALLPASLIEAPR